MNQVQSPDFPIILAHLDPFSLLQAQINSTFRMPGWSLSIASLVQAKIE